MLASLKAKVEAFIAANPKKAVVVAAVAGLVLGLIL